MGMRMTIARFQMTETMECGSKCPSTVRPMVVVEIKANKCLGDDTNNPFNGFFEFFVTSAWVSICRLVETRIGKHRRTPCPTNRTNGFVAGHTNGCFAERGSKLVATAQAEQTQEILVALDMSIESRLTHAEFLRHSGQS